MDRWNDDDRHVVYLSTNTCTRVLIASKERQEWCACPPEECIGVFVATVVKRTDDLNNDGQNVVCLSTKECTRVLHARQKDRRVETV